MIEIQIFNSLDRDDVIKLVLHCQNDGSRHTVSVDNQPDLLHIQEKYLQPGGNFWVAKEYGELIGSIGLINAGNGIGILKKFFVYEKYRGEPFHLGRKLYAEFLSFVQNKKFKNIILDTPKNTERAHKFYEKAGFKKITEDNLPVKYDVPYADSDFFILKLSINEEIRTRLFSLADENYQKFSSTLTPGEQHIIGVRVPLVKQIAREIAKGDFQEYLKEPYTKFHEECLLYGFVIGNLKVDFSEVLKHFDRWLDCIQNWAVCDCSVISVKALGRPENKPIVWQYLTEKLQNTDKPFIKRAIIVAMFCYFTDETYVDKVIDTYLSIKDEHYYIRMALAWGISVIALVDYEKTIKMLSLNSLDKWVQNKAIQKSCESFRLSPEQKAELKKFKI